MEEKRIETEEQMSTEKQMDTEKQMSTEKQMDTEEQMDTATMGTLAKAMQLISDHADPVSTDELLDMTAAIGDFMSETRENLQENSERYQEAGDEEGEAEEAYMKMARELSEEQGKTVKRYVDAVEGLHLIGSDIAYLAGLQDCVKLMRWIGLLK